MKVPSGDSVSSGDETGQGAGVAGRKGGASSNTPPYNPKCAGGGEDYLQLSLGVRVPFVVLSELESGKLAAQKAGEGEEVNLNGLAIVVHHAGCNKGGSLYMAYRFACGGIEFCFSRSTEPKGSTPNVCVSVASEECMLSGGAENVWARIKEILAIFGCELLWSKVSRVDVCADIAGVSVSELLPVLLPGSRACITRGRKWDLHIEGEKFTGFDLGTGDIRLRAYDKLLETQYDELKRTFLVQHRWGGVVPTSATRVEFQLRREALKTFGVDGVEDYLRERARIVAYLHTQWFRMTSVPPDKENNDWASTPSSAFWSAVIQTFDSWTGGGRVARRVRRVGLSNADALLRQARGLVARAMLVRDGGMPWELDELHEEAGKLLAEGMNRTWFDEAFKRMFRVLAAIEAVPARKEVTA